MQVVSDVFFNVHFRENTRKILLRTVLEQIDNFWLVFKLKFSPENIGVSDRYAVNLVIKAPDITKHHEKNEFSF